MQRMERVTWDKTGRVEFSREDLRRTRSERSLDCGCRIPPRFEYRYYVEKIWGVETLIQVTSCEPCAWQGKYVSY